MPTAAVIGGSALLGGAANAWSGKKASEASERESRKARQATEAATEQARADVNKLFTRSQMASQQGYQNAIDALKQTLPAQTSTFQQGNVGAQETILAGLPQIQNAILGNQVDYSSLQPRTVNFDTAAFLSGMPNIQRGPYMSQSDLSISAGPQLDASSPQNSGYYQNGRPVASPWTWDQQMNNLQRLMLTGVF